MCVCAGAKQDPFFYIALRLLPREIVPPTVGGSSQFR